MWKHFKVNLRLFCSAKVYYEASPSGLIPCKFEIEVDSTSVELDSQDKIDLLRQLYKCEGIIRMAHHTAQRHSIYGNTSAAWERLEGLDTEGGKSPEQMIFEDLGIDMYELLGVREKLVDKLERMVAG